MLYQKNFKFIQELRRSSDSRKKRWLIGSSAVIMTFVILLWFFYLGATLPAVGNQVTASKKNSESVLSIMSRGIVVIFKDIRNGWIKLKSNLEKDFADLKESIKKSREFSFEGQKKSLILPPNNESLPPTPLP